ncbi:MAG: hypothetical protein H6841_09105 [Planctomycetes bacterium]|nr:hypothetical protein [Planctomycetota bacterium]MCB9934881.1 hypothetical protein [Planctomycetota bacterium]
MPGWYRKSVVATLLIAALASYANLPRLQLIHRLGDSLNALRVMDPVQHTRMALRLLGMSDATELRQDLDDGQRSLELIGNAPLLQAVAPAMFRFSAPVFCDDHGGFGERCEYQSLTALPGALLKLDLPPPRHEALWQPPRLRLPFTPGLTHSARAPPLGF